MHVIILLNNMYYVICYALIEFNSFNYCEKLKKHNSDEPRNIVFKHIMYYCILYIVEHV